jgi:nicotinate-nucleotide adenylyltransferase
MTARRIGILGGTFDPIHCGHLDVASAAQAALGLTEVLVLPSSIPPHRPKPAASSHHRFAMVAFAVQGRPGWRAGDLELGEVSRSYTTDTLRRLHASGFGPAELFFITGADAFVEIETWRDYPALFDLANFAVVSRRGVSVEEVAARLPALAPQMVRPQDAVRIEPDPTHGHDTLIFLIDAKTADVSSTAIRQARAAGASIAGMVPPSVQQHIEQHRLYESAEAPRGGRA